MSDKKDIGWMYHGAKSEVNREDYLLGKRIDKNFEKYSDAVIEQRPDAIDTVIKARVVNRPKSAEHKVSALQKGVIKSEDPLVAFKVKEELRKQEMMENPVLRMKFKTILKDMMEKKKHKKDKKSKKKKRKRDSSDSDTSSAEEKTPERNEDRKNTYRKRESFSPKDSHNRRSDDRHHVKNQESSHFPSKDRWNTDRHRYPSEHKRKRSPSPLKRDKRKPLTEEEKAAKLKEMQENAEWRDTTRNKNIRKAKEDNEKEEEEEREKKAPSFIRTHLNTATADLSIEQRLHSNKKALQHSHGYMERKFITR